MCPPISRTGCSSQGHIRVSAPLAIVDGRLADARPARRRAARARARRARRRRRGDAAGRRRGARPRARPARGDFDLATTARPEVTIRRARAAGFGVAPTGVEHGTVTIIVDGAADRDDDPARRRRDRRPPRQGAVRPRFRRRRAAARLHHQRAFGRARRPAARLFGGLADLAAGRSALHRRSAHHAFARIFCASCAFSDSPPAMREGPLDAEGFRACVAEREGLARAVARAGARRIAEAARRPPRRRSRRPGAARRALIGLLLAGVADPRAARPADRDRGRSARPRPIRCCGSPRSASASSRTPSGCATGCGCPMPRANGWSAPPRRSKACTGSPRRPRWGNCARCCSRRGAARRWTR